MKFRTEIEVPTSPVRIAHSDKIQTLGSCFAENISGCLENSGFLVDSNPFGILYNPASLRRSLYRLIEETPFSKDEIFEDRGIFSSFWHHSCFSQEDPDRFLTGVNARLKESSRFLREAKILILTFGTSYVYRLKESGQVVSNCHKIPAERFIRERLRLEEIVAEWKILLDDLKTINPDLQILFTISPIRHWKDGAHENQLSKSILLLAVDEIIRENPHCSYFPSYELLLDDLRDYRFYAEDLLHPSTQAIAYIWEKFSDAFFSTETKGLIKEWESIQRDLNHKPFHPDSEKYIEFRKKAEERLSSFRASVASRGIS
ncbi:GSCFA domain-containing protein [Bacteroidales bacterium OttesenSCG-928-A17]|nr:GSCFA domain-containing protein [Bacteroidales bacterium OttesenSCG-928-A17]